MHHLADLVELLEQAADILNLSARAFGNTRHTCATDYFGVLAFVGSHRRDDSFDSLESIVVDIDILDSLAHTGYHGSKVLDITHTLHLLDLLEEIVEGKLIALEFLGKFLSLFFVELLLGTLYERHDITHAEDTVGHTGGIEDIDAVEALACTDKLDRLVDNAAYRQGCTAAGITVELGKYYAAEVKALVEGLGRIHSVPDRS